MDLLHHVGQVEEGVEGADELGRGRLVDAPQQMAGCGLIAADECSDAFDEGEQRGALLSRERLTEERADPADVGAKSGVGVLGRREHQTRIAPA
jgi:hypothetical protein